MPEPSLNEVDSGSGAYLSTTADGITFGVIGAIAGDPDKAIHLDGNGVVNAGIALAFPGQAPYSIEAWVLRFEQSLHET